MFIATAITVNQSSVRSETNGAIHIALLWSCEHEETGFYKHFPYGMKVLTRLAQNKTFGLLLRRGRRDYARKTGITLLRVYKEVRN